MSGFSHIMHAGGLVMYPLLLLSIIAGTIIIDRLIAFSRLGRRPRGLLDKISALCKAGDYERALADCKHASGPVAAALSSILEHKEKPVEINERFVEEIGEEYFVQLEKHLSILDTTTTISPLLGLLGTIVGMIGAFNAISVHEGIGNNDAVLRGVAEALYATATGITIAVICFIAYNYFSARIRQITSETEISATKLLNILYGK